MALNMKRISVSVPDWLAEDLEKMARDEKRSLSNLVAYLLEAACLERKQRPPS